MTMTEELTAQKQEELRVRAKELMDKPGGGLWCPLHLQPYLIRSRLPDGSIAFRCPDCTRERVAGIKLAVAIDQ